MKQLWQDQEHPSTSKRWSSWLLVFNKISSLHIMTKLHNTPSRTESTNNEWLDSWIGISCFLSSNPGQWSRQIPQILRNSINAWHRGLPFLSLTSRRSRQTLHFPFCSTKTSLEFPTSWNASQYTLSYTTSLIIFLSCNTNCRGECLITWDPGFRWSTTGVTSAIALIWNSL